MLIIFLLATLVLASPSFGQAEYLQSIPTVKETEPADDSTGSDIIYKQGINQNSHSTILEMSIKRKSESYYLHQLCRYTYSNDHILTIQDQYLDLSGFLSRKFTQPSLNTYGIQWTPVLFMNKSTLNTKGITHFRIGPFGNLMFGDIPYFLAAGVSFDIWGNHLPVNQIDLDLRQNRFDKGVFSTIKIGDASHPIIKTIPIYAEGIINGTYMSYSKITNGEMNLLYMKEIGVADSFYVYGADTLSIGRTAYFKESEGQTPLYSTTYNCSKHKFSASTGFMGIGSFVLKPSLFYSFFLNTTEYPTNLADRILGDVRNIANQWTIQIKGSPKSIEYDAGFQIKMDSEDWLFHYKFPEHPITTTINDSLIENAKDFSGFGASFIQSIQRKFDRFSIQYLIDLNRYKKLYPHYYILHQGITKDTSIREDKDRAQYHHTGIIRLNPFEVPIEMQISMEYMKNISLYLRKELSAKGQTDRMYIAEAAAMYITEDSSMIKETIGCIGKYSQYYYPSMHIGDYPPMSRKFYSNLDGVLNSSTKKIRYFASWHETYWDEGYWVGSEYFSENSKPGPRNYYAITTSSLETRIEVGVAYLHPLLTIQASLNGQDIYDWKWNNTTPDSTISKGKNRILYFNPNTQLETTLFDRLYITAALTTYTQLLYSLSHPDESKFTFKYFEVNLQAKATF